MRSDPLGHDDVRISIAQRICPPNGVLQKERLLGAGDEIRARDQARNNCRRTVTRAGRGTEDRTVQVRMTNPYGEREFCTR